MDKNEILTEEMKKKLEEDLEKGQFGENSKLKIETAKDLALVHKTKYMPNGKIRCQRDIPEARTDSKIRIIDDEYDASIKHERNTVHFTVNGEVSDHMMGNFSESKYQIIIPAEKIEEKDFFGGSLVDFWARGTVKLPEGTIILCPEKEMEEVKKANPGCIIYGYEGKSADGYGNLLLSKLGYKVEKIGNQEWINSKQDSIDAESILFEKDDKKFERATHFLSTDYKEEYVYEQIHKFNEMIRIIKEEDLIKKYGKEKIYGLVIGNGKTVFSCIKDLAEKFPDFNLHRFFEVFFDELNQYTGIEFDNAMLEKLTGFTNLEEKEQGQLMEAFAKEITSPEVIKVFPNCDDFILEFSKNINETKVDNREEKEKIISDIRLEGTDIIFFSEATQKKFYEQLQENGINISKEQKDIINQLMNSIDYEKTVEDVLLNIEYSNDIREYINQNKEKGKEELIKRILVKEINDRYLLGKELSELNEEEKRLIKAKIDDEVISTEQYDIMATTTKDMKGILQIGKGEIIVSQVASDEYEKNEQLLRSRLGGRNHFVDIEGLGFGADLGTIKPNEKLGEYINRLKKYFKMIQEQIEGDKEINFDEQEQSIEEQEQGKEEKNVEKETAEAEVDNLERSYEKSGIEPTDLKKARKQLETDLNKEQDQPIKNGEENDEH